MKSLRTLVRLHKWNVDQERRHLSKLLAKKHDLEDLQTELEESVIEEQRFAETMESGGHLYAAYAQSILLARDRLQSEIDDLQEDVKTAQDAVASSFRKLKKYEVIEEELKLEVRRDEKKRDQAKLDEIASTRAAAKKT